MQSERRSRGYTLIEVLVAFMIMAMALTVLLRIFSGGIRNIDVASDYAKAVLIAESQLAATGIGEEIYAGEIHGIVEERFEWTRRVMPYLPSPDYSTTAKDVRAWYVTVTVEWPANNGSRSIDISTVRITAPRETGA